MGVEIMGNVMIMRRSGMDISDATAIESNVLSGKTFYAGSSNDIRTGTMVNRGNISQSLNAGGSYTIPAGYHSGSGKITANSLSSQTQGTATAADIEEGKIAWVNGSKIIGTRPPFRLSESGTITENYADTPSASVYLSSKYIASDILETRIRLSGTHRMKGSVSLEAIYFKGSLSSITGDMQYLARITISSGINIFIEAGFYIAGYSIEAIRGF